MALSLSQVPPDFCPEVLVTSSREDQSRTTGSDAVSGPPPRRKKQRRGPLIVDGEAMLFCRGKCDYRDLNGKPLPLRQSWLAPCPRCGLPRCCRVCR